MSSQRDIRNYFGGRGATKRSEDQTATSGTSKAKNRPKPLISDSSDDEVIADTPKVKATRTKKRAKRLSDSDDDFAPGASQKKSKSSPKKTSKTLVNPSDFFASHRSSPIQPRQAAPTKRGQGQDGKKRKQPELEFHDDAEFSALLLDMDGNDMATPSPSKKKRPDEGQLPPSNGHVKENGASKPKPSSKLSQAKAAQETKAQVDRSPVKPSVPATSKTSPGRRIDGKDGSPKSKKETPGLLSHEATRQPKKTTPEKKPERKAPIVVPTEPSLLWVDKYKPTNIKAIIGQQGDKSNMRKLISWLQNWSKYQGPGCGKPPSRPPPWGASNDNGAWAKAALLSGPPGVGKTTTAYLVSKELGYEVTEWNASDTRSKKALDTVVSDSMNTRWVTNTTAKKVLLMDEVDGMAGNEDRGGIAELIQLMKTSKIPIICMCNDRNHQKIRSLANYCFDLRFQKPRAEQIRAAMMSICFKEKVKISPDALSELIVGCNQDVRQVLHQLSMIRARESDAKLSVEDAKQEVNQSQKTSIKVGPWDVCRKVFSYSEHKHMSLMDKSDLFFHDYSIGPLFVQENYLSVTPKAAENDNKKALKLISKASDSFCDGDLTEKLIRSKGSWNLLPVQAMFSSVLPGEYMAGYMNGQINFPNWLGKNSKQNKFDRMIQELQIHTRLSANLSKGAVNRDFAQSLREAIVRPLANEGSAGVAEAVETMNHYSLLREDLDNLLEVTQWDGFRDPMASVESKVKAAFTRTYNKEVFLPYAANMGAIAKKAKVPITDVGIGIEEEADEEDEDAENDGIESDAMIKAKKRPAAKKGADATAKPAKTSAGKGKGKGKGKK